MKLLTIAGLYLTCLSVLVACNSGNSTASSPKQVLSPKVYIAERNDINKNVIKECDLNEDGSLGKCNNVKIPNTTELEGLTLYADNKTNNLYLYMADIENNSIIKCNTQDGVIDINSCKKQNVLGLNQPEEILAINAKNDVVDSSHKITNQITDYLLIANQGNGSIVGCKISDHGNLVNCDKRTTLPAKSVTGLSKYDVWNEVTDLHKTIVYFTTQNNDESKMLQKCEIDTNGAFTNCTYDVLENSGKFQVKSLDGATVYGDKIYLTSLVSNDIVVCDINQGNGNLLSCTNSDVSVAGPFELSLNNSSGNVQAYLSNKDSNSVTICQLDGSGNLINCSNNDLLKVQSPSEIITTFDAVGSHGEIENFFEPKEEKSHNLKLWWDSNSSCGSYVDLSNNAEQKLYIKMTGNGNNKDLTGTFEIKPHSKRSMYIKGHDRNNNIIASYDKNTLVGDDSIRIKIYSAHNGCFYEASKNDKQFSHTNIEIQDFEINWKRLWGGTPTRTISFKEQDRNSWQSDYSAFKASSLASNLAYTNDGKFHNEKDYKKLSSLGYHKIQAFTGVYKEYPYSNAFSYGQKIVAVNEEQKIVLVAYQGTASALQAAKDGRFGPIQWEKTPYMYSMVHLWHRYDITWLPNSYPHYKSLFSNSYIHSGFWEYWTDQSDQLTLLDDILSSKPDEYKYIITGHSLGGAAAVLETSRILGLYNEQESRPLIYPSQISLITYGQPSVGSEAFSHLYDEIIKQGGFYQRVVVEYDPVTAVSPYTHFGKRVSMDSPRFNSHSMDGYKEAVDRMFIYPHLD